MLTQIRPLLVTFLTLSVLTGAVYPAFITVTAQLAFPEKANGSLLRKGGSIEGSELIGQHFTADRYFWGRPSATAPLPYDAASSSGSNLGPTNPDHLKEVQKRIAMMKKAHPNQSGAVPIELVTTSASGLDPHISPAAAEYQISRVATARGLAADLVRRIVADHTQGRTFGILGEARLNVLQLNLALDEAAKR